ncbi:MAG TPA: hypothetical protein VN030_01280 [Cellvibrio sp.]|nr:hypothetical protein [Cellvibrio sp.]
MSDITQNAIFVREVERRVDELVTWILANCPDKKLSLSRRDFTVARDHICKSVGGNAGSEYAPEPAEGGPQYINDNPAPWP